MRQTFEGLIVFVLLLLGSGAGVGIYTGSQKTGGSLLVELMFGVLYLCIFVFLIQRLKPALSLVWSEKWMLALWLLAMVSVVWSVEPGETLRRSIALLGTMMAGLFIGMKYEPKHQIKFVAGCVAIGAIGSLLVCFLMPDIGIDAHKAWQGIYFPKNSLSRVMVLGFLAFAWMALRQRRRRALHIVMIGVCMFLMLMSDSATGIIASSGLILLLPFRRVFELSKRKLIAVMLLAAMVAAPIGYWGLHHIDDITAALSRKPTLTGRTPLWKTIGEEVATRPILGFGYSAFWANWRSDQDTRVVNWVAPNAHSGFLEFQLGLGIVGLLVFVAGLGRNMKLAAQIARENKDADHLWPAFYLLFFGILYNLVETTIGNPNSIYTILYVANSFYLVRASLQPVEQEDEAGEGAAGLASGAPAGLSPAES